LWRPADALEIPPAGDVVIREPHEGWSQGFYEAVVQHYFSVRGTYPRTARMHPSTALAVAPSDRASPVWWPIYEVRRHYAPAANSGQGAAEAVSVLGELLAEERRKSESVLEASLI